MRMILASIPVALAFALAACASSSNENNYSAQLRRLSADCSARGGILVPTGQQSARPQADNACRITGGATRIDQNPARN